MCYRSLCFSNCRACFSLNDLSTNYHTMPYWSMDLCFEERHYSCMVLFVNMVDYFIQDPIGCHERVLINLLSHLSKLLFQFRQRFNWAVEIPKKITRVVKTFTRYTSIKFILEYKEIHKWFYIYTN